LDKILSALDEVSRIFPRGSSQFKEIRFVLIEILSRFQSKDSQISGFIIKKVYEKISWNFSLCFKILFELNLVQNFFKIFEADDILATQVSEDKINYSFEKK